MSERRNKSMIRVLCIDDESDLLVIMKHYLQRSIEIDFTGVTSAAEALETLSGKKIDVIVSDFKMPDMNAFELLSVLRSRGISTPFILFFAFDKGELPTSAENLKVDLFIRKRGEPSDMYSELSKAITELHNNNDLDFS